MELRWRGIRVGWVDETNPAVRELFFKAPLEPLPLPEAVRMIESETRRKHARGRLVVPGVVIDEEVVPNS